MYAKTVQKTIVLFVPKRDLRYALVSAATLYNLKETFQGIDDTQQKDACRLVTIHNELSNQLCSVVDMYDVERTVPCRFS